MTATSTTGDGGQPTTTPTPPVPAATETPAAPAAPAIFGTPPAAPHAFSIGGQATTDYAAVQAHIAKLELENTVLETAANEQTTVTRKAFAKSLATDNKILASTLDAVESLVLTMTPEQFDAYRATYAAAPSLGTLQPQGQENGTGSPENPQAGASGTGTPATLQPIDVAEGVVARLRKTGMPQDQVEKTQAFANLQSLRAAQAQS